MMPSDTEIIDMKNRNSNGPASAYCFESTAIPMTLVEFDTTSAAVCGLNSPATATATMPM